MNVPNILLVVLRLRPVVATSGDSATANLAILSLSSKNSKSQQVREGPSRRFGLKRRRNPTLIGGAQCSGQVEIEQSEIESGLDESLGLSLAVRATESTQGGL